MCSLERGPWGKQGGEGRQGLFPAARGGCGSVLGPRRPEHCGDLPRTGHLPAAGGHTSPSPLRPRCLLEGSRAAPKALGPVAEPPGEGESLWERSLTPLSHSGSSAATGTRWLSLQDLLPAHQEPFLLAKQEAPAPSAWMERAVTQPHQPPVPPPSFSLHLRDRGCDFPLTPSTAVTRNCRAARKLQIRRDKDYFPQKRGENCCICKDFPGPVPSCAHLSGVTPSFKHPSFHSRSRNHLH